MAKEAGKPKVKKRKDKAKPQRPKFCPNTSKSFNLSLSRSRQVHVSSTLLKKNNDELAKTLNLCKVAMARLEKEKAAKDAEIMELTIENNQLRAGPDPQDIEAEVQRRVREHLSKINGDIRAAIDHTIGLSNILTQLCVSSSRASVASSSSSSALAAAGRNSDIGGARLRQVVNIRANNGGESNTGASGNNTWSRGSGNLLCFNLSLI